MNSTLKRIASLTALCIRGPGGKTGILYCFIVLALNLVEIQLALTGRYTDTANVHFKELPPMTVACVTFRGPYDQMTQVNLAALQWCEANHYHFNGTMFSIYHIGPDATDNPADYLTECCFPIAQN